MAQAIHAYPGDEIHFTAGADYSCGDVISIAGLAGVVEGLSGVKDGDPAIARVKGVFRLASASGTTFALGASVEWKNSTDLAVAASGGDFTVGKAAKAKISGETEVYVILNE